MYDGVDLPDDEEFDYDDFAAREFGSDGRPRAESRPWWWYVAVGLLIVMGIVLLRSFWSAL